MAGIEAEDLVVRPVEARDVDSLFALAGQAGVGLTTLPQNRDVLAQRIAQSQASFAAAVAAPSDQDYLFVLAEPESGRVVGTSALVAAVGTSDAFYNYRVGLSVFASRELGVYRQVPTLYLSNDLTGSSELATLFLAPDCRRGGLGRVIGGARYVFMAAHPQRFAQRVIAELRGVADANGVSPFWEGLGRHFFDMDFAQADALSGAATRAFIAELMPPHPLYTVLLPEAARAAVGEVHRDTAPARRLLEREGFRYRGYVDIFDAGPAVEAERDAIRSVRRTRRFRVAAVRAGESVRALVANTHCEQFRACLADVRIDSDTVGVPEVVRRRLGLAAGDSVLVLPLN